MTDRVSLKGVPELAERIMQFCQEDGQTEHATAFACVLAAASLGGEENKRELMGYLAHVIDIISSESK